MFHALAISSAFNPNFSIHQPFNHSQFQTQQNKPHHQFVHSYAKPIKKAQSKNAKASERKLGKSRGQRLRDVLLKPVLHRLTKSVIADSMPVKRDMIVLCPMAPLQQRVYERVLESPDVQLLKNYIKGSPTDADANFEIIRKGELWMKYHLREDSDDCEPCHSCKEKGIPHCIFFPVLSILKNVANHLELVKTDPKEKNMWKKSIR
jgi:SNF2 family DNA or RNA helicase